MGVGVNAKKYLPALVALYLAGFTQALVVVNFPASSSILKSQLAFSDAQYGAIFLPQIVFAILGSFLGGWLSRRVSLHIILGLAFIAAAISQLALAGSMWVSPAYAFTIVLLGTTLLGLGFGLSGSALNGLPLLFFSKHADTALIALHTLIAVGMACGPLLASALIAQGVWIGLPLTGLLFSVVVVLGCFSFSFPQQQDEVQESHRKHPTHQRSFWLLVFISLFYALAEGTFSNWAVLYLYEARALPETVATLALALFWFSMALGRLIGAFYVSRFSAILLWLVLPIIMALAFVLLPFVNTAMSGILCFILAGLGCSAFFPITVAQAAKRFPKDHAWVSSMLIAALMLGIGMGTFSVGALRSVLSFETLYQIAVLYPIGMLVLAGLFLLRKQKVK